MLYVTKHKPDNYVWDYRTIFEVDFEPSWLESELAKEIVQGVDKSTVISPYCIQSPVFGQIAPYYLSGGVKSLLIVLNNPGTYVFGTASFGNNCAEYLLRISRLFDITLYINSDLRFKGNNFEITSLDTNELITCEDEWLDYWLFKT